MSVDAPHPDSARGGSPPIPGRAPAGDGRFDVDVCRCPPPETLGRMWRALEDRANGSFFQSWTWMDAVFHVCAPDGYLVRVKTDSRLVGLAFLGCRRRPWSGGGPSLYLNETGDASCDAVAIEYNGLLAEAGLERDVTAAFVEALCAGIVPRWRDITLSGVSPSWTDQCDRQGLKWRLLRARQPAPRIRFAALTERDVLQSLSRNTRGQVRRSIRFFQQDHPLTLERAESRAQALSWFVDFEKTHTAAWQARGKPGAFGTRHFADVHRHLIAHALDSGGVDLLRLRVDDTILGYLYNFIWRDIVYAYQSAFNGLQDDPRSRPGMVAHVLAMQRYRDEGKAEYRFLAGDARYKRSLSNGSDELLWLSVRRRDGIGDIARRGRAATRVIQEVIAAPK